LQAELLGDEELVWSVLRDLENSTFPEKEKTLFRFVAKVNRESAKITDDDMQPLYAAGWEEAIYYAITVCALFNSISTTVGSKPRVFPPCRRTRTKRSGAHGATWLPPEIMFTASPKL
jgi:hypothetical protein